MIALKTAFRNVFRRPSQNIAVILGVALGVSLFVGVQVGSDSLGAGLLELSIHSIGERDASISPVFTDFFINEQILQEEDPFSPVPTGGTFLENLTETDAYKNNVAAITARLHLQSSVIQPETGAIEVGKRWTGIDPDQHPAFGILTNLEGQTLNVADLEPHQIYVGEELIEDLFTDQDPIGKNLTVQSSITTLGQPPFVESVSVRISQNLTIVDIFQDEGLGRESFSDYLVSPLSTLQELVYQGIEQAKVAAFLQGQFLLGFGSQPLTDVYIVWKDGIEIGEGSETATLRLQIALDQIFGDFAALHRVSDTRGNIVRQIDAATEGLSLLLNGFGAIIILAGVLVIINIQSMALAARERETGILRAVGAKRSQIIRANLLESVFLGVFGSLAGLAGGVAYGRLLVWFLGIAFEFETGDIPVVVTDETLIISFFAGFILSQVTGLIPAINASRINIARVLRGIDAPEPEDFGRKSLYFGFIFTLIGILGIFTLDPNPLIDGNDAFTNIDDVQAAYPFFIFTIVGPALLVAYFRNFRLGLTVVGLFLLGFAYFNVFYVLDKIEGGSGGLSYIIYLVASLLVGTVILTAVNLDAIASAGQRITAWFARSSTTPVRGTTMVAFKKMRSKVTRSTLTFALFATILTLNIWIGTFSYSFRFGVDSQVVALTGGSDLVIYSPDNPLPASIGFSQELVDEFDDTAREVQITDARGFMRSPSSLYYLEADDPNSNRTANSVAIGPDSFWDSTAQENWIFPFDLFDNKTETPFETYEDQDGDPEATFEDEVVWKALANNETMANTQGEQKPILITTFIFDFSTFTIEKWQGESVYLNLTDGTLQEFVIGSISNGAPLSDLSLGSNFGPPGFSSTFYVNEHWKDKLLAFSGISDNENVFLARTNIEDQTSSVLEDFLIDVEGWANAGSFQNQFGSYGIIGVTTYSIYEGQLEGQFRFFQFLQAFVSLGFVVGILGLVVVAFRSVAERKREIGMLRALGFRRRDVVVSVVLELIVMGMIGLVIGFVNGTVMGYALTSVNGGGGEVEFLIPWGLIGLYAAITFMSAILSAIFPAVRASQIPPSDALRYTG
ncbi:MAG: ABC transporter permease [Candidatus Kariarchaeaceae archaeon]|jgi:ABC-type antimicrobial peptide transport system permease subunit